MLNKKNILAIFVFLSLALILQFVSAACVVPTDGMNITVNTVLCNGTYNLPHGLFVKNEDSTTVPIVLDCNGAKLIGGLQGPTTSGIAKGPIYDYGQNNYYQYGPIVVKNCEIFNYSYGFYIFHGYQDSFSNNVLSNNGIGAMFDYGYRENFTDNVVKNGGLTLELYWGSSNFLVTRNNFINNRDGLYVSGTSNNIYLNNFIDNGPNRYPLDTTTIWNTVDKGNYWSNYDELNEGCVDSNSNNICDSPYLINNITNNTDYYPLKTPYVAPAPTCTSFTYSAYSACNSSGIQTRTVLTSSPAGCAGGSPVLSRSCTYVPPVVTCTSFTYSAWSACQSNNQQTRTVVSSAPAGCTGGSPILTQGCTYVPPVSPGIYSVSNVVNGNILEYRFSLDGSHFISILTSNGNFAIRPHPGLDVNGWGGTLYLQPFLPGAVLRYTTIQSVTAYTDRIEIVASGLVSKGATENYGTWTTKLTFTYDPNTKKINGFGNYNIALTGKLSATTGDLNLLKIANNYLTNVPLLTGSSGDTGDMKNVQITIDNTNLVWNPVQAPGYFPQNTGKFVSMNVIGQQNIVDSASQGYAFIQPAYKPTIMVSLNSTTGDNIPMIFGGIYILSESQQFWRDNIGITPLIKKESTFTNYNFDIKFSSSAIAGDGLEKVCDGKSDFAVFDNTVGKWYILNKNLNVIAWDKAFGAKGMISVAGDYDGDKKSDLGLWNPSDGKWYVYSIAKNVNIIWAKQFGSNGMIPVSGDYDGDGKSDLGLWNPIDGKWYVYSNAKNQVIVWAVAWGSKGMIPVSGDYDGDGKSDLAVWNPVDGKWYIRNAANTQTIVYGVAFGSNGMKPVSGDYNGNGKSDLAVWNPVDGKWYIREATNLVHLIYGKQFGAKSMIPASGDYDGDGKSDLAMFNPSDTKWYIIDVAGNVIVYNRRQGKTGILVPGDYCSV